MSKTINKFARFVLLLPFITVTIAFSQGKGSLTGKVVDASNGEFLIGANVLVLGGGNKGAVTNLDGQYLIKDLTAGTYDLQFSYVSYRKKIVKNIEVKAGEVATINIDLDAEAYEVGEVVVEAEAVRNSDAALLAMQRKSGSVSDAVSEEQIKKSPDSDAGDAVKRVTGVSVVGGKYVYVRGLGERYSNTQLNDVQVPSPESEKKVVPFDMFPSSLIQNIVTEKTFTPDQPGNFSGGMVKINTKEFPTKFFMNFGLSTGSNSEAMSSKLPSYAGGGTDFLGFDDGKRTLPSGVPTNPPQNRPTAQESAQLAGLFNNQWTPEYKTTMPNLGAQISVGDQTQIGEMPLGYLFALTYSSDYAYQQSLEQYPTQEINPATGRYLLKDSSVIQRGTYSVVWGALANLSTRFSDNDKVSIKAMFNRSADDETRSLYGFSAQGSSSGYYRANRLRFLGRSILSSQLTGEHQMKDVLDARLDWTLAYSLASRQEPDNRENTYALDTDNGQYFFPNNFGSGNGRFFADLTDNAYNIAANVAVPFTAFTDQKAKVKAGYLQVIRTREFSARRFLYQNVRLNGAQYLSPEQLFDASEVAAGNIEFADATTPTDSYDVDETSMAGYLMVDMNLLRQLRFIGGARFENTNTELKSFDPLVPDKPLNVTLDNSDVLPSVNLIYNLSETMNLRAAAGRTMARPEFRELAPFRFDDYRTSTFGNSALKQTFINNYDLRWEWYPNPGEIIAVSGFYKTFIDPIERVVVPSPNNIIVLPINASDASNIGVEFEARKNLGFLAEAMQDFSFGANVTLVHSEIEFKPGERYAVRAVPGLDYITSDLFANQSRPLEGQSPYVVNLNLGYGNPESGTTVTVLYNIVGKRIREVGTSGYEDTYELPRSQVDLTVNQAVTEYLSFKAGFKNLLDEDYVFRMGNLDVQRYNTGRAFSLSLSYAM